MPPPGSERQSTMQAFNLLNVVNAKCAYRPSDLKRRGKTQAPAKVVQIVLGPRSRPGKVGT